MTELTELTELGITKFDGRSISEGLDVRDIRVLRDDTFFEQVDAKRKTAQAKKDFINDQDSTAGPAVIDNIIRNIIAIKHQSLRADRNFGLRADSILFEQLDWANLEFIRTIIASDLNSQLPSNIDVHHIDLKVPEAESGIQDTLEISISYSIKLGDQNDLSNQNEPGPKTVGDRKFSMTLDFKGFEPGKSKFREVFS